MRIKGTVPVCLAAAVAIPTLFAALPAVADEVFNPTQAITLPKSSTGQQQKIQSFDISWVDPRLGLYFLADRTNKSVHVVDIGTNNIVTQLTANFAGPSTSNDTAGPNGVLTIGRQVWAGDGNSTVKVIELNTGKLVATIPTGGTKRADELCYDPDDQLVMMANDADSPPFVTLISTSTHSVVKTITMNGKNGTPNATNGIEQCQWNPRTKRFLLNIPEVNGPGDDTAPGAVLVISPKKMAVERTFMLDHDKCAGPQGMAIGPDHQVLLGCNAPSGVSASAPNGNGKFSTVVINDQATHIIATLNNESGADEVWFNPGDNQYFLARSAANGSQQLGVVDAGKLTEDASRTTNATGKGNVHSVAADPVFNQVYVPIPSTATAGVCSSAGGTDSDGCIAVYTTPNDDRGTCIAEGAPVITADADDGGPVMMRGRCRHRDRH